MKARTTMDDTHKIAAMLLLAAAAGCQGIGKNVAVGPKAIAEKLDVPSGVPWKAEKKPEPGVPSRVVATWKDAVLQQQGKPSQRGFGGRLFFYDDKSSKPIPVEGQLVVYAFDETGRKASDNRPTKRYVFPVEQFALHESDSELGVSYSFWLPWDEAGGPATDISLMARFEPTRGGQLVLSEQAAGRLPGAVNELGVTETSIAKRETQTAVQQASHSAVAKGGHRGGQAGDGEPRQPERRMETTTIKLPGR